MALVGGWYNTELADSSIFFANFDKKNNFFFHIYHGHIDFDFLK